MTSLGKSSKTFETSRDVIFSKDTFIVQHKKGYRFNSDSMTLSWFINKISFKYQIKNCLEIGAGSGIVSIVLKKRGFKPDITCIEIQDEMFALLNKNIDENGLSETVFSIQDDFRNFAENTGSGFDLIFSNPPFFGVDSGKINENSIKALSRHEFFGNLNDFFVSSVKILRKNGHFIFVYPVSRIQYALQYAGNCGLSLKDICFFRENASVPPASFAAHLVFKSTDSSVSPDLVTMKDDSGEYSCIGRKIMYYEN